MSEGFGIQLDLIEVQDACGLDFFRKKIISDSAELIKTINSENENELVEKIASVELCLSALKNFYKCEENVYTHKRKIVSEMLKKAHKDDKKIFVINEKTGQTKEMTMTQVLKEFPRLSEKQIVQYINKGFMHFGHYFDWAN